MDSDKKQHTFSDGSAVPDCLLNGRVTVGFKFIVDSKFEKFECCGKEHTEAFIDIFKNVRTKYPAQTFVTSQVGVSPIGVVHRHARIDRKTGEWEMAHHFEPAKKFGEAAQQWFSRKRWRLHQCSVSTVDPVMSTPGLYHTKKDEQNWTGRMVHDCLIRFMDAQTCLSIIDVKTERRKQGTFAKSIEAERSMPHYRQSMAMLAFERQRKA